MKYLTTYRLFENQGSMLDPESILSDIEQIFIELEDNDIIKYEGLFPDRFVSSYSSNEVIWFDLINKQKSERRDTKHEENVSEIVDCFERLTDYISGKGLVYTIIIKPTGTSGYYLERLEPSPNISERQPNLKRVVTNSKFLSNVDDLSLFRGRLSYTTNWESLSIIIGETSSDVWGNIMKLGSVKVQSTLSRF